LSKNKYFQFTKQNILDEKYVLIFLSFYHNILCKNIVCDVGLRVIMNYFKRRKPFRQYVTLFLLISEIPFFPHVTFLSSPVSHDNFQFTKTGFLRDFLCWNIEKCTKNVLFWFTPPSFGDIVHCRTPPLPKCNILIFFAKWF